MKVKDLIALLEEHHPDADIKKLTVEGEGYDTLVHYTPLIRDDIDTDSIYGDPQGVGYFIEIG